MDSIIAIDGKLENDACLKFIVYTMKLKRVQFSSFTCKYALMAYSFCTAFDITHWRNILVCILYAYKVRAILREATDYFEIIKDKEERKRNAVFHFLHLLQGHYFG